MIIREYLTKSAQEGLDVVADAVVDAFERASEIKLHVSRPSICVCMDKIVWSYLVTENGVYKAVFEHKVPTIEWDTLHAHRHERGARAIVASLSINGILERFAPEWEAHMNREAQRLEFMIQPRANRATIRRAIEGLKRF